MDYMGGSNTIIRVFRRGKQEDQSEREVMMKTELSVTQGRGHRSRNVNGL